MASAEVPTSDGLWIWGRSADKPRLLHSMIRVRNLEAALQFYRDGMGMTVLDRHDYPDYKFSIAFLSFGGYEDGPALELTYNYGVEEPYTHGTGYGHIALGAPDVPAMFNRLIEHGGSAQREPYPTAPRGPLMAFVKDPDGYTVELIGTRETQEGA